MLWRLYSVLLAFELYERYKTRKNAKFLRGVGLTFFTAVILLFSLRNIDRCPDWKDNNTLFIADTDEAPESAKIQLNAGIAYLKLGEKNDSTVKDSLLKKAMFHLQKGIAIYPAYADGYLNMGVVYSHLRDPANMELWWNKARKISPNHDGFREYDKILSSYYFSVGLQKGIEKKFTESISNMMHALRFDTLNADILYNLGGAYFTIQKTDSAKYFFQKTLSIISNYQKALAGLQEIEMHELKERR